MIGTIETMIDAAWNACTGTTARRPRSLMLRSSCSRSDCTSTCTSSRHRNRVSGFQLLLVDEQQRPEEVVPDGDDLKQRPGRHHRLGQRQVDAKQDVDVVGAVDVGGLAQLGAQAQKIGAKDDGCEHCDRGRQHDHPHRVHQPQRPVHQIGGDESAGEEQGQHVEYHHALIEPEASHRQGIGDDGGHQDEDDGADRCVAHRVVVGGHQVVVAEHEPVGVDVEPRRIQRHRAAGDPRGVAQRDGHDVNEGVHGQGSQQGQQRDVEVVEPVDRKQRQVFLSHAAIPYQRLWLVTRRASALTTTRKIREMSALNSPTAVPKANWPPSRPSR